MLLACLSLRVQTLMSQRFPSLVLFFPSLCLLAASLWSCAASSLGLVHALVLCLPYSVLCLLLANPQTFASCQTGSGLVQNSLSASAFKDHVLVLSSSLARLASEQDPEQQEQFKQSCAASFEMFHVRFDDRLSCEQGSFQPEE